MDSNIVAQVTTGTTLATDNFYAIEPRSAVVATAANARSVIPVACTFKKFYLSYVTTAGGGFSRTFTLQKNGVDTAVSITIPDGSTSGNDTVNTATFAAGDTAQIRTSATGTTANFGIMKYTLGITAAASTSLVMGGSSGAAYATGATSYIPIQGDIPCDASSVNVEQVMPTAGTFKNTYVDLSNTIGASPRTVTFTLYKNGSPTSIVAQVSNNGSTANDLTHTVSVAAGDRFYWEITPSATAPTARLPHVSMEFDPTTNGESVRMSAVNSTPSTAVANSIGMQGTGTTYSPTDNNRSGLTQACTFKNMYVYLAVAPGALSSWQVQTSIAGSAGNPAVTISDPSQTGNDTSNTVAATVGQTASFRFTPNVVPPAATNIEVGIVSFIQPVTAYTLTPSDTVTITDSTAKTVGHPASDSVTITDAAVKAITKLMTDTVTITDAATKTMTLVKADSVTITDANAKTVGKKPSDAITAADSFARTMQFIRAFADTITLSDASTQIIAISQIIGIILNSDASGITLQSDANDVTIENEVL